MKMDMPAEQPAAATPERLRSLDALRGFDMFWIIGGYWIVQGLANGLDSRWFNKHVLPQTEHVRWEGFVAWDLIMPLFLFIVGVAMPFSFARRLDEDDETRLYHHIAYRVIILWILGMIAQGHLLDYDLSKLQLYSNTLQAIAAGYLIASLILLSLPLEWQVLATGGLLLVYWALLTAVPVPGHGSGQLTEQGNLAIYIDKLILGRFQDGTDPPYTWILSSLTFGATVMIGALAGQLLRSDRAKAAKVLILLGSGVACVLAGWAWGLIFPIIKHIWTSSMVLYAAGWSLLLLGLFYLVIDVLEVRFLSSFFVVIGMNAIAAYMATHVFDFRLLGDIFTQGLAKWTGDWHDFARAVGGVAVLWLILYFMYRKRIFIKI
jgi:predicted acyltransferase